MKNNFKITIPLAILVTLLFVTYQRMTGPTYPKKFTLEKGQQTLKVKLLRSHNTDAGAPLEIPVFSDTGSMTGTLYYKRFPTNDEWTAIPMSFNQKVLQATLPPQPPAGKLQYYVELAEGDWHQSLGNREEPIIIRYKGAVPASILAPHVFFMFISMLFCIWAAFEAKYKTQAFRTICFIATGTLFVGGMILGPLVQKYAFNVYWAGFPFDWDLTDNKLLISMIFLAFASAVNLKSSKPWAVILAAVVLFAAYAVPHSRMGSQFNYEKGKIVTDK
ncbi:MAG: hypothetical protein A2X86_01630 [Bdellovibrionales bacterium GWA2_49_15]|nr:MAG: hypothetical protein A2X86_01630 [Bdellovibrionales bacterium GWA2_49_15]